MLEGDEIVGNFPRMWEVWNGCLKVMWLWETFLAYGKCRIDATINSPRYDTEIPT